MERHSQDKTTRYTTRDGLIVDTSTDPPTCMGYIFNFSGHGSFAPSGKVGDLSEPQVEEHNRLLGQMELEAMARDGRARLYLFYTDGKPSHVGTWASGPSERFRVQYFRKSWHNFAGRDGRTDVYFTGPDGKKWHGVNIGDNAVLRAHRLKGQ